MIDYLYLSDFFLVPSDLLIKPFAFRCAISVNPAFPALYLFIASDVFKKGRRVMTPGGKHRKELKKVYKNKKDANDYMAAIMIAKGGG